ncbi:hypothetical protein A2662_04620 [Candidatus Giovannonibacteria bacterium RIFCSPHIGHO2_01_FULL_45_33]|uniref:PpiC domain-containing protein n=1 Tax=Candidatus Giovannonibacteria bacterium RIFCSPLOWO2_01_FULL_45_34 TaxID=1798351 RepID=A0A1F5WZK1_9BACT|nr:MAG: hypothetical protein A2662_04620 [Candidatus Giovannonibacteria bacterium RIFCSPHIGHO2_01_FULL_45_33]OGF69813.1 MAG: hypothetical protein A3C73_03500 [Candidatus Giovannonibacteria bacterium RIFCSPHIGHO2_02_FULL_44_11]OGF81060.1 MAG: hypothetical protein A2930_03335 [Candidatus Giovannonibacteria bacterium RIFCSPLOWO2_01_FULL_45_34]
MFPEFLKQKYIIILAIVILLAGAAVWYFGFAPVMSVEGKNVSIGEFSKIKGAISRYDEVSHAVGTTTLPVELNRRALSNIIEIMLVDKLVSETDPSINQRAEDVVKEALAGNKNFSLADAAERLYGLSEKDFMDLVLIPQAKRSLLLDHFKDDPTKLNDAWENINKTADIKIYYPGYYWESGEVKTK